MNPSLGLGGHLEWTKHTLSTSQPATASQGQKRLQPPREAASGDKVGGQGDRRVLGRGGSKGLIGQPSRRHMGPRSSWKPRFRGDGGASLAQPRPGEQQGA